MELINMKNLENVLKAIENKRVRIANFEEKGVQVFAIVDDIVFDGEPENIIEVKEELKKLAKDKKEKARQDKRMYEKEVKELTQKHIAEFYTKIEELKRKYNV
jgi:hypothetical protein